MVLIAIAAIFTMLCERTAGMLSNLMNAEEQEKMLHSMKVMQEKSQETSGELRRMVRELSEITESSMESNGQIVEETGSVLQSFSENMEQIHTSTNECKEIIWKLGEESKEILGIINVITGISNQTNILALNASIEAARAGVEMIEDMVVRIRALADSAEK